MNTGLFVSKIIDTRNHHTHYPLESNPDKLRYDEFPAFSRRMRVLLHSLFLITLGLPESIVRQVASTID